MYNSLTDTRMSTCGEEWKAEELPLCALADDRVVEVTGEPRNVQRATELVVAHLRKFLVDRSVLPLFELNVSCLHKLP